MPTRTACPSTTASKPRPATAVKYSGEALRNRPRPCAPSIIAVARGCSEPCSALATRRNISCSRVPGSATTSVSSGLPLVIVPVLSSKTARAAWMRSRLSPPLMRMPCSAPLPVPTIMAVGVANPRAQGQATTRTVTAATRATTQGLLTAPAPIPIPSEPAAPRLAASDQPMKVSAAITRTTGTKMPEMVSANR